MAITATDPSGNVGRPFKMGTFDAQFRLVSAVSGATSGTLTATCLARFQHVVLPSGYVQTSAPTFSEGVATLAFTVPAETAAAVTIQSLTYTAVANLGTGGNSITVAYTAGGTAGAEVVTVVGNAISVQIESGVSTRNQVKTALLASAAATALVVVTGASGSAATSVTATALTGGVTGGASGYALCLGRP